MCNLKRRIGDDPTLLEVLGGGMDELEGNELESTLLEAGDDVATIPRWTPSGCRSKAYGIGKSRSNRQPGIATNLDHDVGALSDGHFED